MCKITRSSNYLAILTKDDHRILLAHLAPGTIPAKLCPFEDTFMNNANVHPCGGGQCSPFPAEAAIPEAERPKVRRGDFIGRAGSSGASFGPHLHLGNRKQTVNAAGILVNDGANRPYLIENAWMRPAEAPSWTKLEGWELKKTDSNPRPLIKPSPFLRSGTETAGGVKAVSLAGSVTSVINTQNKLQLIAWGVSKNGAIQRQQSAEGVAVEQIASARPGAGRDVVTAVRNAGGNLRVDYWDVSANGTVSNQDHKMAGSIGDVAVTPFPAGKGVIVAVKTGNGKLKLITYEADANGNLERKGSVEGGSVRAVSVAHIRKGRRANEDPSSLFKGAATAVKGQGGKLRIRTWLWNENNKTLSQAGSHTGDSILGQAAIAAVPLADDRQMLVTAARTETGMLLSRGACIPAAILTLDGHGGSEMHAISRSTRYRTTDLLPRWRMRKAT